MPPASKKNQFKSRLFLILITVCLTSITVVGGMIFAQGRRAEQFDQLKLKVDKIEKDHKNGSPKIIMEKIESLSTLVNLHAKNDSHSKDELRETILRINSCIVKLQTDVGWIKEYLKKNGIPLTSYRLKNN